MLISQVILLFYSLLLMSYSPDPLRNVERSLFSENRNDVCRTNR